MTALMLRSIAPCVLALALAAPAAAQTPLPMGAPAEGRIGPTGAAVYTVAAAGAGVLVAAVRGDADLVLRVADEDGQALPGGQSDQDLNGSVGTELVSVVVPEAGTYQVRVTVNGGGQGRFEISGAWMSFPAFELASHDPDRRPGGASVVNVGAPLEDTLNGAEGDERDWFVLTSAQAGTLVVILRRNDGDADLVLEAFLDGDFAEPAARSDQDLQGNSGNESVTLDVRAGQAVHVRVSSLDRSPAAAYRLTSSLAP
jgi:hypothetical protein